MLIMGEKRGGIVGRNRIAVERPTNLRLMDASLAVNSVLKSRPLQSRPFSIAVHYT
jgi:hypothetical protein